MANTKGISTEEKWMQYYFEELQEAGFIKEIIYQPKPITLFESFTKDVLIQLKTKDKIKEKKILSEKIYTPDFKITWNDEGCVLHEDIGDSFHYAKLPLFFSDHKDISYIEVKSDNGFDNNMTRLFTSRTQPWIWDKHNIFVNLIKVPRIFRDTFVPEKVRPDLYYKRNTKKNKINDKKYVWEYKSLNKFLDG